MRVIVGNLHIALQSLGCRPEEAIAIENTDACAAAPVGAGIVCIGTPNRFASGQNFSHTIASVTHLGDLGNSATHLGGRVLLEDGMVTVDTLCWTPRSVSAERSST